MKTGRGGGKMGPPWADLEWVGGVGGMATDFFGGVWLALSLFLPPFPPAVEVKSHRAAETLLVVPAFFRNN